MSPDMQFFSINLNFAITRFRNKGFYQGRAPQTSKRVAKKLPSSMPNQKSLQSNIAINDMFGDDARVGEATGFDMHIPESRYAMTTASGITPKHKKPRPQILEPSTSHLSQRCIQTTIKAGAAYVLRSPAHLCN